MDQPDQLRELFRMQNALNERIGVKTNEFNDEQKTECVLNYCRAMSQELAELTDSVPWKWWAKYQKLDEQNARVEVVDLFHFLISLAQTLGMSADDVFEAYVKKNEVNFKRQESGYTKKDEDDSRHIQIHNMRSPSNSVAKILVSEEKLQERVTGLANQIKSDFKNSDLIVVGLLTGTIVFLADLIRKIDLPLRLDFIGVSSYGNDTESSELVFTKELKIDVKNQDLLIVDDILDTGKTLKTVIDKLKTMQPRKISTCVLLSKKSRRKYEIPADYVGFEISNEFVVGYGLDYAEQYRNLPFIGALND